MTSLGLYVPQKVYIRFWFKFEQSPLSSNLSTLLFLDRVCRIDYDRSNGADTVLNSSSKVVLNLNGTTIQEIVYLPRQQLVWTLVFASVDLSTGAMTFNVQGG